MNTRKCFTCRFCGRVLNAWLPVPGEPDGAMLLQHLSHTHPDQAGGYLARMHCDEDIAPVAAEAFMVLEGDENGI
jgi:hypothetical protein